MSDILLDSSGDIDLTEGNMTLTSGTVATAQRLKQALQLFLGEWFLDQERGIPYFQQIFKKSPNPTVVDAVLKRAIINDPAVIELQQFSTDLDTLLRVLTVEFKVLTTDGPVEISITVP